MTLLNTIKEYGVWLLPIVTGVLLLVAYWRARAGRMPVKYAGDTELAREYRRGVRAGVARYGAPIFVVSVIIAATVTMLRPVLPKVDEIALPAFHALVLVWLVTLAIPSGLELPESVARNLFALRVWTILLGAGLVLLNLPEAVGHDNTTLGMVLYAIGGCTLLVSAVQLTRFKFGDDN